MAGKLVISRLVQDKLTYECQVRGIGSGSVEEMRKSLAKAIRMENEGTTLPIPTYPYTFEEDMLAIRTKIEPIETGIAALTTSKSNKHKKLETTLNHLLGRLKRSKPQNDDEIKERSEVLGKILALMTDVDNRCEKIEKQQQIVPAELSILEKRMPRHSSFEQDFGDGDEEENELNLIVHQFTTQNYLYYAMCGFIAFFEEYGKAGDVEQDDPYRYRHSCLSGFTTASPFHHVFFITPYKLNTNL
ncbi:hypothetical protein RN001_001418 [Aquatica leii]|uniref:Uncharacterized protein n=1 Tax=Aquatica leii TaxID=1421715 RepID=A0AAN7PG03_9COLE|nr:hypothetical protein RN001_001418 [Aquatica leii]